MLHAMLYHQLLPHVLVCLGPIVLTEDVNLLLFNFLFPETAGH